MSSEKIDKVWLVLYTKSSIEVVGIFTDLPQAVATCKDKYYVVGPFELNRDYTDVEIWDGAFRPSGDPLYPEECDCEVCNGSCENDR